MTAPLTPREAAIVARFDEAEAAPESLTERVARVILDELDGGPFSDREWRDAFDEGVRDLYRAAADAAIRVVTEDARS